MTQTERLRQHLDAGRAITPMQVDRRRAMLIARNLARATDLTGTRCNALTVIRKTDDYRGSARLWLCLCDCGHLSRRTAHELKTGKAKSCGCLTRQIISECRTVHGETESPTWKSWKSMLDRCYIVSHKSYGSYGGRGITVCDRWHDYSAFRSDMGIRPFGMTLGRINHDLGYFPGNCEWQSYTTQARTRRNNRVIQFGSEQRTLAEWAEKSGLSYDALHKRLLKGWTVERAILQPAKRQKNSRCTSLVSA